MPTSLRRTVSWGIMLGTTALTAYYLMQSNSPEGDFGFRSMRRFWNNMGWYSILLGLLAVGLWIAKKNMVTSVKTGGGAVSVNGNTLMLLRDSHILTGWMSFVLGLGHSIYYLTSSFNRVKFMDTGIAATLVMFMLIIVGVLYQYKAIKMSLARKLHLVLAVILAFFLLAHI